MKATPLTEDCEMSSSGRSWASYRDAVNVISQRPTSEISSGQRTIYQNMLREGLIIVKAINEDGEQYTTVKGRELTGVRTKKFLIDKKNDVYETTYYIPDVFMLMHTFLIPKNWDEWAGKSKLITNEAIPLMCGMTSDIWKNREDHQLRPSNFIWEQWVGYISRELEVYELDESLPKFRTPTDWLDWGRTNGLDKPSLKSISELDKPDICLWEPFASAVEKLTVPQEKNLSSNASSPLDTKWEDMTWTFLTNELVKVEAKGVTKKYLYSELGFTDRRKGDSPDTRWAILSELAKNNGEITWKTNINSKEKNMMSAAVRDIRKRLKDFFNIDDDPFHSYRKTKSYKTKFTIKDNRYIDYTDDSAPDDFSE